MKYEVGDEITVEPKMYGDEGDAIAYLDDQIVIVQGGKVGQEYTLQIEHISEGAIFTEYVPTAARRKDIVQDHHNEFQGEYVVINRGRMTISDWELEQGDTIADLNPEYPAKMKVINIVNKSKLDEKLEGWEDMPPNDIYPKIKDEGIKWVNLPEHRLEKTGSERSDSTYK